MDETSETAETPTHLIAEVLPIPGLALAWCAGAPICRPTPLGRGPLLLGRSRECALMLADESVSSKHAVVGYDGGRWTVEDVGSRNGTYVDGVRVHGQQAFDDPRVLRLGEVILLFEDDVARFDGREDLRRGDYVIGPEMNGILEDVVVASKRGWNLLITGETGTGKEHVARWYHSQGPRVRGDFVDKNCGAFPSTLADSELFGSVKGAFTGATRAQTGLFERAHRGTLFLDEVARLPSDVQPKLLRVVETGDLTPVGADRSKKVDVALVSATNEDLEEMIELGTFRKDLRARLSQARVFLPPLDERLEELPFLIVIFLAELQSPCPPSAQLIEACLLRSWPENARQLKQALTAAIMGATKLQKSGTILRLLPHSLLPEPIARARSIPPPVAPVSPAAATAPSMPGRARKQSSIVAAYLATGSVPETRTQTGASRAAVYRALQRAGIKLG